MRHNTIYCDPNTESPAITLENVLEKPEYNDSGTFVYGESGRHHETQLICGHFAFDKDPCHPLIDVLPEYINIRNYGADAGNWMENTLQVIGSEVAKIKLVVMLLHLKCLKSFMHKLFELILVLSLQNNWNSPVIRIII